MVRKGPVRSGGTRLGTHWCDGVSSGVAVQGEAWLELARPDRFRSGGTWYDKAQQGRLSIGVDGDMEWRYRA